jgi:deazaflavin-dependent oxidoreductase (nitroreductase family)
MTRVTDRLAADSAAGPEASSGASAAPIDRVKLHQDDGRSDTTARRSPRLPPRLFVRVAWVVHRAIYRASRGRRGLWEPKADAFGTMRLNTIGRRSGQPRVAIVGYYEDGPNLVTLAMNGWAAAEPAWWLNLQAQPETTVELKDGVRAVRARAAEGDERDRLWARWHDFSDQYDAWAALRSRETAVVVLEPRAAA